VHWFSIMNSFAIVLLLTATVAIILVRILRKDLSQYNEVDLDDEKEETGWKLVHGDVFRPPRHGNLLSVLVGTGSQLIMCCFFTLLFACLGFLSPANRGALMTALLILFVFMGMLAGYQGTRLYKQFGLVDWKKNTLTISLLFPGVAFAVFFVLDILVWGKHSTAAVPFGTMVALLVLWFGISAPLVYLGSYFAMKKPVADIPVRVNNIPRMIPEAEWYNQSFPQVLAAGCFPFGAVMIELFFILTSIWNHQFYYMFGMLGLVFIIVAVTCVEISIVLTYTRLNNEDYHWWWASFLASGSSALYLFLFSIMYYVNGSEIVGLVPSALYFGQMFLMSFGFFILTGTFGFMGSYQFVNTIYASVKID